MTSILRADNITTVAGTGNISLNTGNKIISPDIGGIVAPKQVIQVVTATNNVLTTMTASAVTIATATITIRAGSSIHASFSVPWFSDQGASWNNCPNILLYRDTTLIQALEHQGIYQASGASAQQLSGQAIDLTLGAGTYVYTIKINHVLGNTGGTVNRSPRYTQLTLMEIAQ